MTIYRNTSASSYTYTGPKLNAQVQPFHCSLPDYAVTPLVPLPALAQDLGLKHVLLKDESHRLGLPAFKILGASWAVFRAVAEFCNFPLTSSLPEIGKAAKDRGVRLVTCTEGNWGRAVSRMAKYLDITAIIFVPDFMDEATQEKIRGEGAEVVVVEGDYDYSITKAREEAARGQEALLVMDVSWKGYETIPEWVVEGYITMLIETDKQLQQMDIPDATHVIASVGVGSWAQAVTMHYKSKSPSATVLTVEPDTAASLKTSLEAGKITSIPTGHTIMNGMNCGTVSTTAWKVLREGVDASVTVTDIDVHHDLQYIHEQGVKNGPCGAATMSALKRFRKEANEDLELDEDSVVVLFSTEGAREYVVPA